MDPFSGIVHNGGVPGDKIHLPLEEMSSKVLILDGLYCFIGFDEHFTHPSSTVSSRVTVNQTYVNHSDHPTSKARYYFPVPASAAICSFEMRTSRGRVITGVAKEKLQAREEHERAIASGRFTGLLEWVTDDSTVIYICEILNLINRLQSSRYLSAPFCQGSRR